MRGDGFLFKNGSCLFVWSVGSRMLLEAGANPNAQAANGYSPLHVAVAANLISIVGLLLRFGADPTLGRPLALSNLSLDGREGVVPRLNMSSASSPLALAQTLKRTACCELLERIVKKKDVPDSVIIRVSNSDIDSID